MRASAAHSGFISWKGQRRRGSCLGLRDELNSSSSPFSSVTESYLMNSFCFFPFHDVQETRGDLGTTREALSEPLRWLRMRCREGLLGSWRRQCLCSEKELSVALPVDPKEGCTALHSRVKPRERVKAQKIVKQMNKLKCE